MTAEVIGGLVLGLLVGIFNHRLVTSVVDRVHELGPDRASSMIVRRYFLRLLTSFGALALTYVLSREVMPLLATLGGLLIVRNYYVIAYLRREGGWK